MIFSKKMNTGFVYPVSLVMLVVSGCTLEEMCFGNNVPVDGNCQPCKKNYHASDDNKLCVLDTVNACGYPAVDCNVPDSTGASCVEGRCSITCDHHANYELIDGRCVKNTTEACGNPAVNCVDYGREKHGTAECVMGGCKLVSCDEGQDCKIEACQGNAYLKGGDDCEYCKPGFHVNDLKTDCVADTEEACGYPARNCKVENSVHVQCVQGKCDIECNEGSYLENNVCVPNSLEKCGKDKVNCTIENGTSICDVGTCKIVSCNENYHVKDSLCVPDKTEECGSQMLNCTNLPSAADPVCKTGVCDFTCKDESLSIVPNAGCFKCKTDDVTHTLTREGNDTSDLILSSLLDGGSLCTNGNVYISSRVALDKPLKIWIRDKSINSILNTFSVENRVYAGMFRFPDLIEFESLVYAGGIYLTGNHSGYKIEEGADITKLVLSSLETVKNIEMRNLQLDELTLPKLRKIDDSLELENIVIDKDISFPNLETFGTRQYYDENDVEGYSESVFDINGMFTPNYYNDLDDTKYVPGHVVRFPNLHTVHGTFELFDSNHSFEFPKLRNIQSVSVSSVYACDMNQIETLMELYITHYGGSYQFKSLKTITDWMVLAYDDCNYDVMLPQLKTVNYLEIGFNNGDDCTNDPVVDYKMDSITEIQDDLIISSAGKDHVQSISFASLTHIGGSFTYKPAFNALNRIDMPKLESIDGDVTYGGAHSTLDSALQEISFPELTHVKSLSIYRLNALESVSIPKLKKIGDGVIKIKNCKKLKAANCDLGENKCEIEN